MATDSTNLTLTRSVAIPSESRDTEILHVIQPSEKGLHLNLAARVDGDAKHPFGGSLRPFLDVSKKSLALFLDSVGRTELEFGEKGAERGAKMQYETLHGQCWNFRTNCPSCRNTSR